MRLELLTCILLASVGCAPSVIPDGKDTGGTSGSDGGDGADGADGSDGADGADGGDGGDGSDGGGGTWSIFVNELVASNLSLTIDPEDPEATPDWVELHNPSDLDLDLEGFTVTDDLDEPGLHTLGPVSLPAGGFVLLFADGKPELGPAHLSFKLGADEDEFAIYTPDGIPLDQVRFSSLDEGQVAGRYPDAGPLALLSAATPGESNNSAEALDR